MTNGGSTDLQMVTVLTRSLREGATTTEALTSVARSLREGFGCRDVTIWHRAPNTSEFVSAAANGSSVQISSIDDLPSPGSDTQAVPLRGDGRLLGLLQFEGEAHPAVVTRSEFVTVIAELLSLYLEGVELSENFASEVATRSDEAEAQRVFMHRIVDSLPVGLYVIDREYRIQAWNRKREIGTQGLMRDDVMGRLVFDVLTRQAPETLKEEFDFVFGSAKAFETDIEREDRGRQVAYRIAKIPMCVDGKTVTHVLTIGEDVSEARTAQRRVQQSEKLAAIGQLAAGVMHEINNPLATIGACATALDGLLAEDAGPKGAEYLEIIEREVHRCSQIVDSLLDFSRPPDDTNPTPVDVNDLVNQTMFLLKHHKRFRQMVVRADLGEGLPAVQANSEQMIQVLMALMLNAVDAMDPGGALTIRTRHGRRAGELVVEVQDAGIGIPAENLTKIFEPFYTTKPPGRGTGLGLSICYGIIERHRGQLTAESRPGHGSVFRMILPTVEALR